MKQKSKLFVIFILIGSICMAGLSVVLSSGLSAESALLPVHNHAQHMHHLPDNETLSQDDDDEMQRMMADRVIDEADFSAPHYLTSTVYISISNFVYSPAVITVTKGATLVWTNYDTAPHTVTSSSGRDFDSGFMGKGATYSMTVTETGTTNYFCAYHFGMISKFTVVEALNIPSTATPTPTPAPAGQSVAPCYTANNNFSYDPSVPVTTANASGQSMFLIDTRNNLVSYRITYTQVTTTEQRSHIHEFVPANVTAPARYTLPKGTSKIGVWQYDESNQVGILTGQTYVNIHNANFPNGEIRAQMNNLVPCKRIYTPMLLKK